ncbi:HdeD family acid-resistance protein [Saccharopolyspora erythraea]|uniref:HdeD family acid-resistance protein n=1 Tax=Saccharopolyspora erythraea TaxID=1836 RepID=UPI0020117F89|nr:HdeD family acid-resistance protein [Saccharopolyspora erythraea]
MSQAQWQSATSAAEPLGKLGRSWGWLLTFGILTVLAGVLALFWPGPTILAIAIIFGVQLLVGGIYWFVRAVSSHGEGGFVPILLAVLAVIAGLLVLRSPIATAALFPLVLGVYWTVSGIGETFHALVHRDVPSRGWAIAGGVLSILAGIALLVYPGVGLVTLTYLLGALLVIYGAIAATRAIQMRPQTATDLPPQTGPAHA